MINNIVLTILCKSIFIKLLLLNSTIRFKPFYYVKCILVLGNCNISTMSLKIDLNIQLNMF